MSAGKIPPRRVIDRALARLRPEPSGCVLFQGKPTPNGYGQLAWRDENGVQQTMLAHRVIWYAKHGQFLAEHDVDHTCYTRLCCNLDHLREIPHHENSRRRTGDSFPLGQCRNGHSLAEQVQVTGQMICGPCDRLRKNEWNKSHRERVNAYRRKRRAEMRLEPGGVKW